MFVVPNQYVMSGPWANVAAAGVSAGAGIGGSLIAARQSRQNQNRTIAANKEMAQYAYQMDLEQWNRQNEYNSPAAQMARLKEAGLNPNLVYGNGSVGNNAGPGPKYQPPDIQYTQKPAVDLPMILGVYQDFQMRQAQINNLKAQEENTRARTLTESFNTTLRELQGQETGLDIRKKDTLFSYDIGMADADLRKAQKEVEISFQKLRLMKMEEISSILSNRYKEKALSIQDIEKEQREADLLFSNLRNDWAKMGVTSSDSPMIRIIVRMMKEAGMSSYDQLLQGVKGLFLR